MGIKNKIQIQKKGVYFLPRVKVNKQGNKTYVTDKSKLIRSRELYRIISQVEQIPIYMVQDVFNCFTKTIYMALEEGYDVNIPFLGFFTTIDRKGHKKGDLINADSVYESGTYLNFVNSDKIEMIEQNGHHYWRYKKDTPDYKAPNFKIYKSFIQNMKDETGVYNNGND